MALAPGPYIRLWVCDGGMGIQKDLLDHIFRPFFTTKDRQRHCGLGLSGVRRVIRAHEGRIRAFSDQGTRMEILLPCHDPTQPLPPD